MMIKKVSLYWDANWLDRQKVMRDKDEDGEGEGEGSKWNEDKGEVRRKELKQISSVHCDSL